MNEDHLFLGVVALLFVLNLTFSVKEHLWLRKIKREHAEFVAHMREKYGITVEDSKD